MISIVNYGLGNLGSIQNMLKRTGHESVIVNDPAELNEASKIILPGVGAFDTGMKYLTANNWLPVLNKKVLVERTPVLGICLGMQLMTKSSQEGVLKGLGWIDAEVVKFTDSGLRVPHMGWNIVNPQRHDTILKFEERQELRYYFVHSYYVKLNNPEDTLAFTPYGTPFASAFQRENIFGVQFHPEKSHKFGMTLMKNFAELNDQN